MHTLTGGGVSKHVERFPSTMKDDRLDRVVWRECSAQLPVAKLLVHYLDERNH